MTEQQLEERCLALVAERKWDTLHGSAILPEDENPQVPHSCWEQMFTAAM